MFIYREDMTKEDSERKNIADVIVAKHRNGPTDTVPLFFQKELTRFADLEYVREPLGSALDVGTLERCKLDGTERATCQRAVQARP